jgi:hypothetical protein
MRKYILLTVTFIIGNSAIFSQLIDDAARRRDSIKIDSMQKLIPVKKDTARVNYLNKFSYTIIYAAYPSKIKADWALPYIETSYKESKQAGYDIGVAKALLNFCRTNI